MNINKILLVAKKELDRFFGDRRMVISALIFPGVLIYIVYAILTPFVFNMSMRTDRDVIVYIINPPSEIQMLLEQSGIGLSLVQENEKEMILEGISRENGNFLIVFPENFIEEVMAYNVQSGEIPPEILLYYNSLSGGFAVHYGTIISGLHAFERSVALKFDINRTSGGDMAAAGAPERHFLAIVLPIFLLVFIFQGAMAATTEAISGEKERGTFATIFISSITSVEIAAGKILGLGIQAFLCGISGTLGIVLALPRLVDSLGSVFAAEQGLPAIIELNAISLDQYGIGDLGILILVLLSSSCLIVTLIAIVAIHAKTAKEAQILVFPMLIVFLFISFLNVIYNSGSQRNIHHYLIPIYNSVQSMSDIFGQTYTSVSMLLTIGINIFLAAIGCFTLSLLIKTEKIMTA